MQLQQTNDFALKPKFRKIFIKHCLIFSVILLYFSGNITCPFFKLTDIKCPTCGVSRAMLALVRLDLDMYFYYHPLAIFLVTAVLLLIHIQYLPYKKFIYIYAITTVGVNFIFYIVTLTI